MLSIDANAKHFTTSEFLQFDLLCAVHWKRIALNFYVEIMDAVAGHTARVHSERALDNKGMRNTHG